MDARRHLFTIIGGLLSLHKLHFSMIECTQPPPLLANIWKRLNSFQRPHIWRLVRDRLVQIQTSLDVKRRDKGENLPVQSIRSHAAKELPTAETCSARLTELHVPGMSTTKMRAVMTR